MRVSQPPPAAASFLMLLRFEMPAGLIAEVWITRSDELWADADAQRWVVGGGSAGPPSHYDAPPPLSAAQQPITTQQTLEVVGRYLYIQNWGAVSGAQRLTAANYSRHTPSGGTTPSSSRGDHDGGEGEQQPVVMACAHHNRTTTLQRLQAFIDDDGEYLIQDFSAQGDQAFIRFAITGPARFHQSEYRLRVIR
jgi:hypothetical protein